MARSAVHVRIKPRPNESPIQVAKRFRKMLDKEGVIKEMKKRLYYQKPSEINSRKRMQKIYAIEKQKKEEQELERQRRNCGQNITIFVGDHNAQE